MPGGRPPLSLLAPFAVLLLALWQFLAASFRFLRSPYSPDFGEGQVMALVQRVLWDGTLFGDMQRYPMVLSNYPPVYVLLNVPGFRLFGPSLLQPRLVSFLATLGIAGFLFALLRRRTGEPWMAGGFALLVFAPWFVQTWAATARIDLLAQMLTMAGLLAFDRARDRPGFSRDVPFLLFAVGFYTRQTTLVAPAAAMASLLLDPARRRELPRALAAFAVPVLGALAAMNLATDGQAWLHLFPYAAAAGYDLAHMARWYRAFLLLCSPLVLLALAGLALQPRALLRGPNLPIVLFWPTSLAALSTIAKEGAAQNYFIEPFVATVLAAGVALGALVEARPLARRLWPAVLLLAAAAGTFVDRDLKRLPQAIRAPERSRAFAELDEAVRKEDGPVLSENMSVLVVHGKRVWVDPWAVMLLAKTGIWDPATLAADCRRGMFALVVEEWRLRDVPGISECLDESYVPWKELGPYQLYRPKRPPVRSATPPPRAAPGRCRGRSGRSPSPRRARGRWPGPCGRGSGR
jgi:hypothetical protein